MNNQDFILMIQAALERMKSVLNIKNDIKIIQEKLPKIKLVGTLDTTKTKQELNAKTKNINPKVKIDADTSKAENKIKKLGQQKKNVTITPTVNTSQAHSEIKALQKETKSFSDHFTSWFVGANLIHMAFRKIAQAIHEAVSNAKELDKLKTNIQMASGMGDSKADYMMRGYNQTAKDLSSTTKDVAESADEFIRMGESVANTNELIRNSQMLSKIGKIQASDSASYLISSMKGYKIAAEDSISIVDKLTSVDMEAAVSAGGLAEALSKCANIANNSGTSMNRLIGYVATVGEVTQKSMSEVGNSFQSIYSRISNIKIGKFTDDETGESLSDTEAVLGKLGIKLRDTADTYREADDVLDDIGKKWSDFTQVEQNAISVAVAGTRQRENFLVLMNNYSNALKYAETAANSSGTALERYAMYQDSVEAKTNELTAALESMSMNAFSEELFGEVLGVTTGLVECIDKTNLLKGSMAGLMTLGVSKMFVSVGASIIYTARSTSQLTNAMNLLKTARTGDDFRNIGKACIGLSDSQLKLILSTKGLTEADRLLILEGKGVVASERKQKLETLGLVNTEGKATTATFSLRGAWGKYSYVMQELFAQADTGLLDFYDKLNADKNLRQFAEDLKGLKDVDLRSMVDDDIEDSFDKLIKSASEFGLNIDDVISMLQKMGIVASTISEEDIQPPLFDSSAFMDEVSKIQEGYDKLIKAKTEFDEYGAITASTLKDLTDNNLIQYLEFTADGLSVNTTALEANEQALKDAATAELYNAMCADIQNLSLGDTGTLSDIAQQAIANLDSVATTAGENAAIAAKGWWEYGASIQNIPGVENLVGDNVKKAEAIVNSYKKIANSINSISIGKTNSSQKSSSNKAKDAEKAAKEASEKAKKYATEYIKYQDRLLENGKIDYNTYCNSVQNMLDDLYHSGKITAEEYFGYVEQKLNKQFDVYKKALSAITKRIQKEADKWKDKIDALQKENDLLDKQKDKYDSVLSAVEKVYDDEIKKIEDKKTAIQDVIDAMNDENDEYERQLALQKAIYNFNRAMNQKTQLVYKDGQMTWQRDESAVRDSQDELKDAQHNVNVAELQKKQDDLDTQIENLQKYKDMWSEVANAYQIAQDDMNAKAVLGQNYAQLVLQNNIADIENFKNQYVAIDEQIQDNTLLIESYQEKQLYYEQLKEQWEEIANVYEEENERQCAAMLLGKDWEELILEGRTETLENFKEGYVGIQTKIAEAAAERAVAAAEKAMRALNDLIATANAAANVPISGDGGKPIVYTNKTGSFLPDTVKNTAAYNIKKTRGYGSGTTNAKKGLNWVGENDKDEIFIDNDGNASLITEPTLIPMEGGETVKNPAETKKILNHDDLAPVDTSKFIITDEMRENFIRHLQTTPIPYVAPFKAQDLSNVTNNVDNRSVTMEVNINCPNVTNDSGAEYLKREIRMLTTKVMQR